MTVPKPPVRPDRVSLWRYLRLFRRDLLSAQPARLYRAWMAEFRTPFFRSYMCNDPALVRRVLQERPDDFPKSGRVREGLVPLLGQSVFVTNGEIWKRQRRIIDPAFEGGRLRDTFPAMWAAGEAAVARLPDGSARATDHDPVGLGQQEHAQAGQVQADEGQHPQPVDAVGVAAVVGRRGAGVEPQGQCAQGAAPGRRAESVGSGIGHVRMVIFTR